MRSYTSIAGQEEGDVLCWKSDSGGDQLWIMHDSYCENPECPGCGVHMCLLAADDLTKRIPFVVDLDGLFLEAADDLSPEARAVVEDFCRDPANQHVLSRRRQLVRAWGLAQAEAPSNPWHGGCYHFGDFDPHEERYPISYDSKGVDWLVIDQYCVVPTCACVEAGLSFFRLASKNADQCGDAEVETFLDLRSESCRGLSESDPPLTKDQRQVVSDFKQALPAWKRELSLRRNMLRRIAAKRLTFAECMSPGSSSVVSEKKPARNAPCPCGSGKKYKKCCGKG